MNTLLGAILILGHVSSLHAGPLQGGEQPPNPGPLLLPPEEEEDWPGWCKQWREWREQVSAEIGYRDSYYADPDFAWVSTCFNCAFVMLSDPEFYNRETHQYRVAQLLERADKEFGGYDSVVLWHAYPRIGFDDRNQFDFYRDMPGGIAGLRNMVDELHREGVRVFLNYNPWDRGTRPEPGSEIDAMVGMVAALGADGLFLDTMHEGELLRRKLDALDAAVVLESELALPVERIHDHHMSWAQWIQDGEVPGVLRNKWFEPRHMQHQIHRWNDHHWRELQLAFMNGSGMMIWENVFGAYRGWNAHDRSVLRSMVQVQRRFHGFFSEGSWIPRVPTRQDRVYAGLWELGDQRLWTLANRSSSDVTGELLEVSTGSAELFLDLLAGEILETEQRGDRTLVRGRVRGHGVAAVLALNEAELGSSLRVFLEQQRGLDRSFKNETDPLPNAERRLAGPPARRHRPSQLPKRSPTMPPSR